MDRAALVAALKRVAGTERVLIYDVPEDEAPHRANQQSPFVRGPKAWWSFIERRRKLDDGADLNLLISMRGLRADERMLVISWGCAFANSFLLVEPSDPWLDLTTAQSITTFAGEQGAHTPDEVVRKAYAEWIYWVRDENGELESRDATLNVGTNETFWEAIWSRLPQTFPESAFLSSLTLLNLREAELFTGGREVKRAIIPFLTRLGMPILYDAHHVMHGVRELVNVGLAWVADPKEHGRVYRGPEQPLPAEIPDERLAAMTR